MTAPHIVEPSGLWGEALADASPDLMRRLLQDVINTLLSADADAVVGAEYGRPGPARAAQRNGYRHRDLDTRVGTIDVAIPRAAEGHVLPGLAPRTPQTRRVRPGHGRRRLLSRRRVHPPHGSPAARYAMIAAAAPSS